MELAMCEGRRLPGFIYLSGESQEPVDEFVLDDEVNILRGGENAQSSGMKLAVVNPGAQAVIIQIISRNPKIEKLLSVRDRMGTCRLSLSFLDTDAEFERESFVLAAYSFCILQPFLEMYPDISRVQVHALVRALAPADGKSSQRLVRQQAITATEETEKGHCLAYYLR